MLHFAASLGLVSRQFAPIHGLIAHSLGGTAAIYALGNLELSVDRIVTIAPSARLREITERFGEMTGFHPSVIERMRARFEQNMGFDWDASEPLQIASEMSASLMVIHDKEDRFVPYREGTELANAWPEARLMSTFGLGHHRILRDRDVVNAAADFISEASLTCRPEQVAVVGKDDRVQSTPMI